MSQNLGTLRIAVQGRLQDVSASTMTQIINFLNWTVREMCSKAVYVPSLEKNATIVTSANVDTYSLPSDFERMYDIYQKNTPAKLTYMTQEQKDNLKPDPTSSGQTGAPLNYSIFGTSSGLRQIILYPIPDKVYTMYLRYLAAVTDMVSDIDTNPIPDRWQWLVIQGAYAKACEYNEEAATTMAYQMYNQGLVDFLRDMEREVPDQALAMRVMIFDSFQPLDTTANPLNQS